MDPAQTPHARPVLHGAEREPERPQLHERHDTPLAPRELREGLVDARAALGSHVDP
jgi:hypothetical protein